MPVFLELQNAGDLTVRNELQAVIEHVLSNRPGDWRVSILGSRAKEEWDLKLEGPNGFERSYTLVGSRGEHEALAIGHLILKLLPSKRW